MGKKKSVPVKKAPTTQTAVAGKAFEKVPAEDESKSEAPVLFSEGRRHGIGLPHLLGAIVVLVAARYLNNSQEGMDNASLSGENASSSDKPDFAARMKALANDAIVHYPCTDENLAQFLHDEPTVGMHLVCFTLKDDPPDPDGEHPWHDGGLQYTFDRNMYKTLRHDSRVQVESNTGWEYGVLKKSLEERLRLPLPGPTQQPYALFTPRGERIWGALDDEKALMDGRATADLLRSEMVIVMEQGTWTWPGVRIGFTRTVDLYSIMPGPPGTAWKAPGNDDDEKSKQQHRTAEIETLSLQPLVVSVRGFIDDDECDYIQTQAGPTMAYSGVSLMDKDKGRPASDWRTSQSTFLHARADTPTLYTIEQRTASLTRIPRQNQEDVQVLRYGHSEKYDAHHDFFNPALYQASPDTLKLTENGRRNRQATVFWYLSDVAKGGETVFPRFGGAPQPRDFKRCDVGLKAKPEKGKVIIFYDLLPNGQMDDLSLHGGCPVEEGVKWAANKWVWNAPMQYVSSLDSSLGGTFRLK